MPGMPRKVPATMLREGMQTLKEVEDSHGDITLKRDVKLKERWADTPGFVHNGRWPHVSFKTDTNHLVVYSPCASVWVV